MNRSTSSAVSLASLPTSDIGAPLEPDLALSRSGRWFAVPPPRWWVLAYVACLPLAVGPMIQLEPVVSLVLALLVIPPAAWFYISVLAKGLHLARTRGVPIAADLADAPNLRWHTPACVQENSRTFEVRVQCSITGADTQSVDAIVTSSEQGDVVDTFSFNKLGTHRIGEFTFRIRAINNAIAQVTRRIAWRVIYFDTQGRFGYVTDCWADVSFDGNRFQLGKTFLDLSGPKERQKKYRNLPRAERHRYRALFSDHSS